MLHMRAALTSRKSSDSVSMFMMRIKQVELVKRPMRYSSELFHHGNSNPQFQSERGSVGATWINFPCVTEPAFARLQCQTYQGEVLEAPEHRCSMTM